MGKVPRQVVVDDPVYFILKEQLDHHKGALAKSELSFFDFPEQLVYDIRSVKNCPDLMAINGVEMPKGGKIGPIKPGDLVIDKDLAREAVIGLIKNEAEKAAKILATAQVEYRAVLDNLAMFSDEKYDPLSDELEKDGEFGDFRKKSTKRRKLQGSLSVVENIDEES